MKYFVTKDLLGFSQEACSGVNLSSIQEIENCLSPPTAKKLHNFGFNILQLTIKYVSYIYFSFFFFWVEKKKKKK